MTAERLHAAMSSGPAQTQAERILWKASSDARFVFTGTDYLYIPFSLVFSAAWGFGGIQMLLHDSIYMKLFSVFFLFGAYHVTFGRIVRRYLKLRSSVYTLTEEQLKIEMKCFGKIVATHEVFHLSRIHVRRLYSESEIAVIAVNQNRPWHQARLERGAELTMIDGIALRTILYPSILWNIPNRAEFLAALRKALSAHDMVLEEESSSGLNQSFVIRRRPREVVA